MSTLAPLELTRQHFTRLRHYWRGAKGGAGSRTDLIDLDLAARGYIERTHDDGAVVRFRISQLGEVVLAEEHERQVERCRPHHELAGRLAFALRSQSRVTWENIQILADADADGARYCMRPDLFSVVATCDMGRLAPQVHEVKVSRADFLADVRDASKRKCYFMVAERVYYVAEAGMILPAEVPEECGLIVETTGGQFEMQKQPKKRKVTLSPAILMNLLLKSGQFNPL
ncbi:hypothetical protein [Duganella vulcania]|uniref:Uncharacterized protein n=1 Tax=Duganella vulcania TaxID=2692166 RepID=A0A845GHX5_9BURK|nr:hypothetical protein [Duganella vulcania]MYM92367.1 hypothetical protein [Duganella vulcania]